MKIALGTVQFGLSYGIANNNGKVTDLEARNILSYAKKYKVDTIDTAITYGTSEQCLGAIGMSNYYVITKLPEIPDSYGNLKEWVESHVKSSLNNLRVSTLSGLLLHRPMQLLDTDKKDLWPILLQLKADGVVNKIGFSIYSPSELDRLWSLFKPDLVQAPYNIFDRRLETSGWLDRMHKEGAEVHIRSIFLQGLLLMEKKNRPEKFNKWLELWNRWDDWLRESNATPTQATVAFALSDHRISKVVIGVDNLDQFKEIISASQSSIDTFFDNREFEDTKLLDPSKWSLL